MVFSSGHSPYEIPRKSHLNLHCSYICILKSLKNMDDKTNGQGEKWAPQKKKNSDDMGCWQDIYKGRQAFMVGFSPTKSLTMAVVLV